MKVGKCQQKRGGKRGVGNPRHIFIEKRKENPKPM
jgi:hypothetical protein